MLRARFIPTLLLSNGGLCKTVRFKNERYVGDPVNAVRIFNDKAVDELVLLDIHAHKRGTGPDYALLADIVSEAFVPLCYGGGITSLDQIERLFALGMEKVSINSAAVGPMSLITEAARVFGSQSLVVGIDVKRSLFGRYDRYVRGGSTKAAETAVDAARRAQAAGAGELLLYDIDRDGTMQGFDLALVREVAQAVTIPVVACGGAGALKDLALAITDGHAASAAAGSMFVYQGRHRAVLITYPTEEEMDAALDAARR